MIKTRSSMEIMSKGMSYLIEHLGIIETEQFISEITKEKFDYTKWQKEFFENIPDDVLMREAVNYDRTRPYNNNKGSGNYTEERDKLLAGITLEDVMRDFEQNLNLQDNIKHEDKRD